MNKVCEDFKQLCFVERTAHAHNIGIAKMQAGGSRVSAVVILLGCISSLTLKI